MYFHFLPDTAHTASSIWSGSSVMSYTMMSHSTKCSYSWSLLSNYQKKRNHWIIKLHLYVILVHLYVLLMVHFGLRKFPSAFDEYNVTVHVSYFDDLLHKVWFWGIPVLDCSHHFIAALFRGSNDGAGGWPSIILFFWLFQWGPNHTSRDKLEIKTKV